MAETVDASNEFAAMASGALDHADHVAVAAGYNELQQKCPVQRMAMPDGSCFWAVLGSAELDSVLKDHATFSSAIVHFGDIPSIPIELDPPRHTHYRRVLNAVINHATVKALEVDVHRYVVELIDTFVAQGGGDIVPVTKALPLRVLCKLLGVPDEDWKNLQQTQTDLVPGDLVSDTADAGKARMAGLAPVLAYAQKLIQLRRSAPANDVVSKLLAAQVDGTPMTDHEALQMMMLLLLAGHETTGNALSGCVLLLSMHQNVQHALRTDPTKIPAAVEECLRTEPPVQTLDRQATRDIELGGQKVTAGAKLLTVYGAANVDERAFASPQNFDPTRTPNRHFTFGRGIHACVGAPIARMELRIFLEELLSRTQSFTIRDGFSRNRWPDIGLNRLDIAATAKLR
jgi:cytochrome P450